jgi:hypothetical protein
MKTEPILAHAIGHTIIGAAVGDHETRVDFSTSSGEDYVSVRSPHSWVNTANGEFYPSDGPTPFLNTLCIRVAGYVGESVFAEPDTTLFFPGDGWYQLGRDELVAAHSLCEKFAMAVNIPVYKILEACMVVVGATLHKYQDVAERLSAELEQHELLAGFRFAALLAAIKEEDLSLSVRQLLGLEMGESS